MLQTRKGAQVRQPPSTQRRSLCQIYIKFTVCPAWQTLSSGSNCQGSSLPVGRFLARCIHSGSQPITCQAAKPLLQSEPDPACNLDKSSLVASWSALGEKSHQRGPLCDLPSVSSSREPFLAPLSFLSRLLPVNKMT